MLSFIVLITLCATATCANQNTQTHILRHLNSDRGQRSAKNVRSEPAIPLNIYPNSDEKDGMMYVQLDKSGKRAEKKPYEIPSMPYNFNGVPNNKFEPYANRPMEMDAISQKPFSVTSNNLPYQTKDGAPNSIYSANPKPNEPTNYMPYMSQKQVPSSYANRPREMDAISQKPFSVTSNNLPHQTKDGAPNSIYSANPKPNEPTNYMPYMSQKQVPSSYANRPREMDAISQKPFSVTSNNLPHQTKDGAPNSIYSANPKPNEPTNYMPYISQEQMPSSYANRPREMDAMINAYSLNPLSVTPNNLPYQTKDNAPNSIYSAFPKPNDPSEPTNYLPYTSQEQMPSSNINYIKDATAMTYEPLGEPTPKRKMVPQWSSFPEKVEYIIRLLKKNMEMASSPTVKLQFAVMQQYPPWIHYTLLLTICLDLINGVVSKGEDAYELDFDQTVIEAVNKVTADPQQAAENIMQSLDTAYESISPILRYINNVIQTEICFIAEECDTLIEHALIQTSNLRLKLQAILLQASINLADIFMNQHSMAFEEAAQDHRAFEYVFNIDSQDLAPLVAAGYTVKMIRKYLNPTDISAPFKW